MLYNGNTAVSAGKIGASNLNGTSYQFTIVSDPSTRTYSVVIDNLDDGSSSFSSGPLDWRNTTATEENTFLNFVSRSGASSAASFGYSLDSVAVIPEPGNLALLGLGGLFLGRLGLGRRDKRERRSIFHSARNLHRRRAFGFTLVEMLVVVGVLVTLAALGLPVLGSVMEKTKLAKCGNSLSLSRRQTGGGNRLRRQSLPPPALLCQGTGQAGFAEPNLGQLHVDGRKLHRGFVGYPPVERLNGSGLQPPHHWKQETGELSLCRFSR